MHFQRERDVIYEWKRKSGWHMNQKEGRRKGIKKGSLEGDEKEKQKIALKIKVEQEMKKREYESKIDKKVRSAGRWC